MKKNLLIAKLILLALIAFCQTALAEPTVNTSKTTVLSGTSVEVEFYLNWNLETPTVLSIQYSTNSNFTTGLQTKTITPIPSQSGTQLVKATITGLTANTLYYYRLRAGSNVAEKYTSNFNSFTPTNFIKPTLSINSPAQNITANGAIAVWRINANNSATTVTVIYALDNAFTQGVLTETKPDWNISNSTEIFQNYTLTNLSPNTTYFVKVSATNAGGTSESGVINFTTAVPPVVPIVSNLVATSTATAITATFDLDIKALSVTYSLMVSTDTNFTANVQEYQPIIVQGGGAKSISSNTPLTANKKYFYRIKLYYDTRSSFSEIKSVKTQANPKAKILSIDAKNASLKSIIVTTTTQAVVQTSNLVQLSNLANFSTILDQKYSRTTNANSTTTGSALLTGLTSGQTYYYRTIASGADAPNDTSAIKSITLLTVSPYSNATIAEFDFDNSYFSKTNNVSFASNSKTSFTTDRNNNLNSALLITDTNTVANIPNLPQYGWDRTISFWAKSNTFLFNQSRYFQYGTINPFSMNVNFNNNQSTFGGYHDLNIFENLSTLKSVKATDWNHITFTYAGNKATLYINGDSASTSVFNLGTESANNEFSLGYVAKYFNGAIDELKIFNYALSRTAVSGLFNGNNVTGIEDNSSKNTISIYPNPAKNSITVTEFSEVFDLLGNKVAEGEGNIDVSLLSAGLYIVKSTNGTAKLVKE